HGLALRVTSDVRDRIAQAAGGTQATSTMKNTDRPHPGRIPHMDSPKGTGTPYELCNGRIVTRSLEVHVTDHCNLRCEQCCSLSPFLPPWYEDPERLRRDFTAARRVLAPTFLKLVGGEPLLHPRLLDCLTVARV